MDISIKFPKPVFKYPCVVATANTPGRPYTSLLTEPNAGIMVGTPWSNKGSFTTNLFAASDPLKITAGASVIIENINGREFPSLWSFDVGSDVKTKPTAGILVKCSGTHQYWLDNHQTGALDWCKRSEQGDIGKRLPDGATIEFKTDAKGNISVTVLSRGYEAPSYPVFAKSPGGFGVLYVAENAGFLVKGWFVDDLNRFSDNISGFREPKTAIADQVYNIVDNGTADAAITDALPRLYQDRTRYPDLVWIRARKNKNMLVLEVDLSKHTITLLPDADVDGGDAIVKHDGKNIRIHEGMRLGKGSSLAVTSDEYGVVSLALAVVKAAPAPVTLPGFYKGSIFTYLQLDTQYCMHKDSGRVYEDSLHLRPDDFARVQDQIEITNKEGVGYPSLWRRDDGSGERYLLRVNPEHWYWIGESESSAKITRSLLTTAELIAGTFAATRLPDGTKIVISD